VTILIVRVTAGRSPNLDDERSYAVARAKAPGVKPRIRLT